MLRIWFGLLAALVPVTVPVSSARGQTAAGGPLDAKIDRLAAEFNELAELDSTLPPEQRQSVGLALGMRPWRIGPVTGLKERPRRAGR